jgi:hypothetical protein
MTDNEFFKLDQQQWYQEFVEAQLPKNFTHTNAHPEKFVLEDLPF